MQLNRSSWFLVLACAASACSGSPDAGTQTTASTAPSGGEASPSPAPTAIASDPPSNAPTSPAPSASPPPTTASDSSAPPAPSGQIVVGLIFDQSMSHTQIGVVIWREGHRDPVINAGRILGNCTRDSYASLVPPARVRDVVIAVGCDGRGVAPSALSVVEVVKHGDELIVRTADVRTAGHRLTHEHVVQRVPLHGATSIRAATDPESLRAREEIPSW